MLAVRAASSMLALVGTLVATVALTCSQDTSVPRLSLIVRPGNEPTLVAYRSEGTAAWSLLERRGDRYVIVRPAPLFTIVVACPQDPGSDKRFERMLVFHLAAEDTASFALDCRVDTRRVLRMPVRFVDPAEQVWVGRAHASVSTDGRGRIVNRDSEIELPAGRYDWLALGKAPSRISLVHDVPMSTKRREVDLRDARRPESIEVRAEDASSISVSFLSRNGTDFSGLGEPTPGTPGTFEIVPRALRKPGDRDIVIAERHAGGNEVSGVAQALASPPPTVALSLPTARPIAAARGEEVYWAVLFGDPHLVAIDYVDSQASWTVVLSRRWLARQQDGYKLVDTSALPGSLRRPASDVRHWLELRWTSEARVLPLERFEPPVNTTFKWVLTAVEPVSLDDELRGPARAAPAIEGAGEATRRLVERFDRRVRVGEP